MISYEKQQEIYLLHKVFGYGASYIAECVDTSRNTAIKYMHGPTSPPPKKRFRHEVLGSANKEQIAKSYAALKSLSELADVMNLEPEKFNLAPGTSVKVPTLARFIAKYGLRLQSAPIKINKFIYAPADLLEIDFTFYKYPFSRGVMSRDICIFEAAYPFSQMYRAYICQDLSMASWYTCLIKVIRELGATRRILCDNDKSLVIINKGYGLVELNPHFEALCENLQMEIVPCKPRSPQTKGVVERFGRTLKKQGFARIAHDHPEIATEVELQYHMDQWIKKRCDTRKSRRIKGMLAEQVYQTYELPLLRFPLNDAHFKVHFDNFHVYDHRILVYGQVIDLGELFNQPIAMVSIYSDMSYVVTSEAGQVVSKGVLSNENMISYKFKEEPGVERKAIRDYISSCIVRSADGELNGIPPLDPDAQSSNRAEPPKATAKHAKPPKATAKHAKPPKATAKHAKPPKATAKHVEPPKATIEHAEPPKATIEHAEPLNATAEHVEPLNATAEHVEPPKATTEQAELLKATAEHVEPPKASTEHAELLNATAEHVEPLNATAEHVEPPKATTEQAELLKATAEHVEPPKASTEHAEPLKATAMATTVQLGNVEANTSIVRKGSSQEHDNRDCDSVGRNELSVSDQDDSILSFFEIIDKFDSL